MAVHSQGKVVCHKEQAPGHRHMSHLMGLHPFSQITPRTPKLFEAARKAIEADRPDELTVEFATQAGGVYDLRPGGGGA